MYAKQDHDRQFISTNKEKISTKQFIDLFVICLKNDSFKIAFLIYTLYLDKEKVMDSYMMDLITYTIKTSVKHHEAKLFFIHQHFKILTIEQLDTIVLNYQALLINRSDYKHHPMVHQYNPIKIALLIYKICWQIQR